MFLFKISISLPRKTWGQSNVKLQSVLSRPGTLKSCVLRFWTFKGIIFLWEFAFPLVFIFVCIFCTSLRRYIGFPLDLSRLATSGLGLIPTFLSALPCCEGPSHHTPSYQQISRPRICQKNHFWSLNRNDYGFEDIQVIKLSQEQIIYFPKFQKESLLN